MTHENESPLRGLTVRLARRESGDTTEVTVDDWWDRIHGSWRHSTHPLAIAYTARRAFDHLPDDDHVLLARYPNGMERLLHVTEIDDFI